MINGRTTVEWLTKRLLFDRLFIRSIIHSVVRTNTIDGRTVLERATKQLTCRHIHGNAWQCMALHSLSLYTVTTGNLDTPICVIQHKNLSKNWKFSFIPSSRPYDLTWYHLNFSPWLAHKSALIYNAQVHDTTVFPTESLSAGLATWLYVGRHFVALCACPEVTLHKCKFSVGRAWAIAARVIVRWSTTAPLFFPSDALCFGKYCLLTLVLQSI